MSPGSDVTVRPFEISDLFDIDVMPGQEWDRDHLIREGFDDTVVQTSCTVLKGDAIAFCMGVMHGKGMHGSSVWAVVGKAACTGAPWPIRVAREWLDGAQAGGEVLEIHEMPIGAGIARLLGFRDTGDVVQFGDGTICRVCVRE